MIAFVTLCIVFSMFPCVLVGMSSACLFYRGLFFCFGFLFLGLLDVVKRVVPRVQELIVTCVLPNRSRPVSVIIRRN